MSGRPRKERRAAFDTSCVPDEDGSWHWLLAGWEWRWAPSLGLNCSVKPPGMPLEVVAHFSCLDNAVCFSHGFEAGRKLERSVRK
jgi:hypothetical protein